MSQVRCQSALVTNILTTMARKFSGNLNLIESGGKQKLDYALCRIFINDSF